MIEGAEVVQFVPRDADDEKKPRSSVIEEKENEPHLAGKAFCGACGHEWVAVVHIGVVHLECPQCHRMWGALKHAVEPMMAWRCGCGEKLFWITPYGIQCRSCGDYQAGF